MTNNTPSRRTFLTGLGLGAGAGALAAGTGVWAATDRAGATASDTVPFYGMHQAGIDTSQQEHLHIIALDVTTKDRAALKAMLDRWTDMSARMTQGLPAAGNDESHGASRPETEASLYTVPEDSGEATDLGAANLTITIGYGPSLFDRRFGLDGRRPKNLDVLPTFPGDQLQDRLCDGDIVVQACANDPQVAVHAIRNLVRAGSGVVDVRWSQLGYGRASSTSTEQQTPRNLFGFKDGTRNIHAEESGEMDSHVWSDEPGWMNGGSYLCARRVRMLLELWDRQSMKDQQDTFGRYKGNGAPLGTNDEFADVPFDLVMGRSPAIPTTSHTFLAHPRNNNGARMLRRAYNFIEGSDNFGHLSAGLFFIAFVANPATGFIPVQMALSRNDKMNEYVRYESSAVFACPAGLREGQRWGDQLFG